MRSFANFSAIICAVLGQLILTAPMIRAAEFPEIDKLPSVAALPDPLVMADGTRVSTPEQWNKHRKPELKSLFQHFMYGELPPAPKINAAVKTTDHDAVAGKATMKQVTIAFGPPGCPAINLLMFVPNKRATGSAAAGRARVEFLRKSQGARRSADRSGQRLDADRSGGRAESGDRSRAREGRCPLAGRARDRPRLRAGHILLRRCRTDHPGFSDGVFPFYRQAGLTEQRPTDWATSPPGLGGCNGPLITL